MTLAAVHALTSTLSTSTLALPSLELASPALPPLVPTHTLLDQSTLSYVYLTPSRLSSLLPTLSELLRYPVVLQLPIRDVATDLKQVINLRAAGWVVLISSDAQQAYDHTLLASRLANSTSRAVLHAFNAVDEASIAELSTDEAKAFLSSPSPVSSPKIGSDEIEDADRTLVHALDAASLELLKAVRRPQRSTIVHNAKSEAKTLLITVGTTSLAALERSDDVAIVELGVLRPINKEKLVSAIPESVERVIVLEQDYSLNESSRFGGAWLDILDIVAEARKGLQISGGVLGDISSTSSVDVSSAPYIVGSIPSGPSVVPQTLEDTKTVKIPKAESTYTNLLESSFPASTLQILNDPKKLSALESTSPEYAYGKAVSELSEREQLVQLVKDVLKNPSTDEKTHKALGDWLIDRDDFKGKADAAGRNAIEALESAEKTDKVEQILGLKQHFNKHSRWIVSSNSWSYDLGTSGLHHALSGGKNINMLVYETSPSPFSPDADLVPTSQKDKKDRKKDLGLYALNMGDVYVASVAVYSSYATVLQAMEEAERFDGPSLVLAYLPWGEVESDKVGALERLRETKRAVGGGWWPLYRWNPILTDDKRFSLDAPHIKSALQEFLDRQSHLSQLTLASPALAPEITKSAGSDLIQARKAKARAAYDALVNSLDGPPLLVLYASDGGNAEKVAKKLVGRAKMRGVATRLVVFDEFALNDLGLEQNVVFLTSTAGQGEAPQNGRETFKALSKLQASELDWSKTKVTTFGMGDSHYWPRPEDAHYYNKPAKDIHPRLLALGAQELLPLGLGDDQDADGYQTGYKPWEQGLWKALGVDAVEVDEGTEKEETVANEHIKIASDYLRGTILEGLADKSTGAIGASDAQLTKFHGTYMQDDRDIRESLKAQGLEPAYSFMIRVRMPGGVCSPEQWIAMDDIADEHGNSTFKITTRQTFQFHGIIKKHLKPAMQAINRSLLDTIAACGDVNRNVQCSVNPSYSSLHEEVYKFSIDLSEHLLPSTNAYHEIWLDKKKVAGDAVQDFEPLYGPYYLPRKFKIAIAVPPDNAVDVFTNDVGFIAIVENGQLIGYNVTAGGGMGVTHSNKKTYPRLGSVLGFIAKEDGCLAAEKIMLTQRDNGNRVDRKNARLKYTVDRMGVDNFRAEVEERMGKKFGPARAYEFEHNLDNYGWIQGHDKKWHFTMFIENGRVEDNAHHQFKTGLREIASVHKGDFRLTANQHCILSGVDEADLPEMKRLLAKWKLDNISHSALRLSSSACVAFPTCGLAMAESERYLPVLIDKVEKICEEAGVRGDSIVMRMTGCPNGCARPWAAEVAFVGKAPGTYMMMLGGGYDGQRLNKPFRESVTEPEILAILKPMIKRWALERNDGEHFGDWTVRAGIVKPTTEGRLFYDESCVA